MSKRKFKLYRVDMGEKDASSWEHTIGFFHVIATTMQEAIRKAEQDEDENNIAVSVALVATDDIGLIR